jgi:peptidoglycan hydrolase-like protein with peptidoglycan-binding domain
MTTAQQVLDIARSHIGYREGKRNWNVFATRVGGGRWQNQPWCGVFTDDVFDRAGLGREPSSISTVAGATAYRNLGRWLPRNGDVRPGDVVYFDFKGSQYIPAIDHVGFVEEVHSDGTLTTIEGNTRPGSFLNQASGGVVARKKRKRTQIVGFGRPLYALAPPPAPPAPPKPSFDFAALKRYMAGDLLNNGFGTLPTLRRGDQSWYVAGLQRALNLVSERGLQEDGVFGPATEDAVRDFQNFMGLKSRNGVFGDESRWWLTIALGRVRDGA